MGQRVNDERILGLARAALEVDELEAAINKQAGGPARSIRAGLKRLWPVGIIAAAALVCLLVLPPGLRIQDCAIVERVDRGHASFPDSYTLSLGLNRAGLIRIVVVDERLERWVLPFDGRPNGSPAPVKGRWKGKLPANVASQDPRGPARVVYYMVIASQRLSPTVEELLAAIPDPIAELPANDKNVFSHLEQIAASLSRQFDCAVHVGRFP